MSQNGSARILAVTSGKGGVGKTNVSVNLALQLSLLGQKICIFDADLGLANITILLGLSPEYDLVDVVLNHRSLQEIMIKNIHGIDIIPGSSGVERIANLDHQEVDHLIQAFSELGGYDFLFIDTSAGVSKSIISFCLASSDVLIVITPEPTSLTDAYALLKILSLNGYKGTAKIIVNQCRSPQDAVSLYKKFRETVKNYLTLDLALLGIIVKDPNVVEAVRHQQAVVLRTPQSNAAKCIRYLASRLLDHQLGDFEAHDIGSFWSRCLDLMKAPLKENPSRWENESQDSAPPKSESDERMLQSVIDAEQEEGIDGPVEEHGESTNCGDFIQETLDGDPLTGAPKPTTNSALFQNPHDLKTLLNSLIAEVSTISRELGFLRKVVEERAGIGFPVNGSFNGQCREEGSREVLLDFASFMKKHSIT